MQLDRSIGIGVRGRADLVADAAPRAELLEQLAREAGLEGLAGSHLPPGNSQKPARCAPCCRRVTRKRPSISITAAVDHDNRRSLYDPA